MATDVAVYEEGPARPTGGAGAIAILISNKPKIALSPIRASYIDDQYDFYKPIPSNTKFMQALSIQLLTVRSP